MPYRRRMPETDGPESQAQHEAQDLLVPPEEQRRAAGGGAAIESGPASHVPVSLRHIDWGEALPFTHLFKGFRVAIHPSKLLLCLVAVALIYGGMRALDGLYNFMPSRYQVYSGEVEAYQMQRDGVEGAADFEELRQARADLTKQQLDRMRVLAAEGDLSRADGVSIETLMDRVADRRDAAVTRADELFEQAIAVANADRVEHERTRDEARRVAYANAAREVDVIEAMQGVGPGVAFYEYEAAQFSGAINSVLALNFLGEGGLMARVVNFVWTGPTWGFTQHTLYFSLLFLWSLVILSVFGGAVARSAAVQVARDEKISLRSALRFSTGKFVSFLSAPLIPVLVMTVIGLTVALVALLLSLIGLIPGVGWLADIAIGLLFPLAALAGIVMALTFIGLVGGISLMYPTIAVEGTDSFDAISRSFSYLFARPWRLAFYAIVAIIYGALAFLFVRLFAWLVLAMARTAVGLWLLRDTPGGDLLDSVWPSGGESPDRFSYDIPFVNLTWSQSITAILVAFTVYFVVTLLASFAMSLYISLSTIVYFLMRREVDATEPDEVYIDPADEEYAGYADVPEDPLAEPDAEPAPTADGDVAPA